MLGEIEKDFLNRLVLLTYSVLLYAMQDAAMLRAAGSLFLRAPGDSHIARKCNEGLRTILRQSMSCICVLPVKMRVT